MSEKEEYSDLELYAGAVINGIGTGAGMTMAAGSVIPVGLAPFLAPESLLAAGGTLTAGIVFFAGGLNVADHYAGRVRHYAFELRKKRASRRDEVYE